MMRTILYHAASNTGTSFVVIFKILNGAPGGTGLACGHVNPVPPAPSYATAGLTRENYKIDYL